MSTKLDDRRKIANHTWDCLEKNDKPIIFIGTGSCGLASGGLEVKEEAQRTLKELGIDPYIIEVGCIGPCYLEPLMDVKLPGKPRISYSNVTPKKTQSILQSFFADKKIPTLDVIGHFGENGTFEDIPRFFDHPMLKSQKRIVLRNCGIINPENIDHYLARDGYKALEIALKKAPEEIIDIVKRAGLRGRGGAGFPTWMKWKLCREVKSDQKYMICNGDEGDPGAFMNRSLVEGDPHSVLEGLVIAAYAIGASKAYIYIRAEYPLAIKRLKNAIEQMKDLGLIGDNILESGFNLDIKIKEGAGAFVCGEETALINSIEGKRGMPRPRPPFPAEKGLWEKPTIINNLETLGTLGNIIRNGDEWFTQYGVENNRGTKTFSLVGAIRRTGLIEVPLGITLREIIYDIGGGVKKKFKAVQTGGPSGGCLSEEFLNLPLTYESLTKAGSIMGSGGLIVLDQDTCIVDLAKYFIRFTMSESCGKCVPCRIGTQHLYNILDKITRGKGEPEDIEKLGSLSSVVKTGSLCGLGNTAPNPVLSTLKYFKHEYLAHTKEKRCPPLICRDLVIYHIIQDKCTGCGACVKVCPTNAIDGVRSEPHKINESKCIKCRSCYETCKFDAVSGDPTAITAATTVSS